MRPDARPVALFDFVSQRMTAAELRALLVEELGDALTASLPADAELVDIVVRFNESADAPAGFAGGFPAGLLDKLIQRSPEHEIELIEASAAVLPPIRLSGIGLALSGVGFRAAAFHLGALDLLERMGLREQVVRLSTVSGGTILGVGYAQRAGKEGFQYVDFANAAMDFLSRTDIGGASLAELRGGSSSLVVAAAHAYGKTDFIGFGTFGDVHLEAGKLEQVSFNASDLVTGMPFRFARAANGQRRQGGNRRARVRDEAMCSLYLADIAAASACPPVAFEPMLYPRDFRGSPEAPEFSGAALAASGDEPPQAALTDGGVLDSQAFDGLRLGHLTGPDPHLVIVSDATPMHPMLRGASSGRGWGGPPTGVLAAAAIGAWAWCVWLEWTTSSVRGGLGQVHLAIAALLALAGPLAFGALMLSVRRLRAWFPGGTSRLLGTFLRTPVFKLSRLFLARTALLGVMPEAALQLRARRLAHDDLFSHTGATVASSVCRLADAAEAQDEVPSAFLRQLVTTVCGEEAQLRFESPEGAVRARAVGYATLCRSFLIFLSTHRWSATSESERALSWLKDEWVRINGAQSASELLGE